MNRDEHDVTADERRNSRQAGVTALRPSSARRIMNLRALVGEFARRDLGYSGTALLLGCSLSSARNYIFELLDAAVIVAHPFRPPAGSIDRLQYQLTTDRQAVREFVAGLAESDGAEAQRHGMQADRQGDACGLDNFNFGPNLLDAPARRDPLVAALFGEPRFTHVNTAEQGGYASAKINESRS
jgi:hypothetical protein